MVRPEAESDAGVWGDNTARDRYLKDFIKMASTGLFSFDTQTSGPKKITSNLQVSPMGGKAHGGTFQLSGNVQNRPTGMNYDAAGNLLSYLAANYAYDQENRLFDRWHELHL